LKGTLDVEDTFLDLGQTGVMSFKIRDATLADHHDLEGVFRRASLSNENDRGPLQEHPERLVLLEDGIREGRMRLAVDEGDVVVGFVTFAIRDGVAELEDLFVDPGHMRRGIGKQLVVDISGSLRAMGFDTLEVTANPHAIAFYEYMGFTACGLVDTEFYPAPRMQRHIF
jgi:ribosomal protein S18 acetylase RimI-like enzyme